MHTKVTEAFAEKNHGKAPDSLLRLTHQTTDAVIAENMRRLREEFRREIDALKKGMVAL